MLFKTIVLSLFGLSFIKNASVVSNIHDFSFDYDFDLDFSSYDFSSSFDYDFSSYDFSSSFEFSEDLSFFCYNYLKNEHGDTINEHETPSPTGFEFETGDRGFFLTLNPTGTTSTPTWSPTSTPTSSLNYPTIPPTESNSIVDIDRGFLFTLEPTGTTYSPTSTPSSSPSSYSTGTPTSSPTGNEIKLFSDDVSGTVRSITFNVLLLFVVSLNMINVIIQ